jgi:periplasmic divalent cation tolerance protein
MAQDFAQGSYGVVLVTTSSQQEAEAIAQALVNAKLAAGVTMMAAYSIYTWKGEVRKEHEWQMMIQTDLTKFSLIEQKIKELHSYEVPEIIALPIVAGYQPYLQWITDNIQNF